MASCAEHAAPSAQEEGAVHPLRANRNITSSTTHVLRSPHFFTSCTTWRLLCTPHRTTCPLRGSFSSTANFVDSKRASARQARRAAAPASRKAASTRDRPVMYLSRVLRAALHKRPGGTGRTTTGIRTLPDVIRLPSRAPPLSNHDRERQVLLPCTNRRRAGTDGYCVTASCNKDRRQLSRGPHVTLGARLGADVTMQPYAAG